MVTNTGTVGSFGRLLRARRRALDLGLQDLADATGINVGTLSQIENGRKRPPEIYPYVTGLAKRLGLVENTREYSQFIAQAVNERFADTKASQPEHLQLTIPSGDSPGRDSKEEFEALTSVSSIFQLVPLVPVPSSTQEAPVFISSDTLIVMSQIMSMVYLDVAEAIDVRLKDGRKMTFPVGGSSRKAPVTRRKQEEKT